MMCKLQIGADLESGGDVKVLLHVSAQHLIDRHQPQLHVLVCRDAIGRQLHTRKTCIKHVLQ